MASCLDHLRRRHFISSSLQHLFTGLLSTSATTRFISSDLNQLSVLAWGSGAFGVLGQEDQVVPDDRFTPVKVPQLPPDVVGIGAGDFHSLAWTSTVLYSWGRNKEHQLGRDLSTAEKKYSLGFSSTPAPVSFGNDNARHEIKMATGSGVATFVVTKEGRLLVAGTSKRGQLGLGADCLSSPRFIQVPLPGKVTSVAAGWGHAIALVEDNDGNGRSRVFSWGWPAHGRLGHSFASSTETEEDEDEVSARCSASTMIPREITLLSDLECKISAVACGMDSTYCVSETGRMFSFGDNSLGQLGRADRREGEHAAPIDASAWEVHVPRESDPSKDVKWKRVAAGLGHFLAVSTSGNLYASGWNVASQLGLLDDTTDNDGGGSSTSNSIVRHPRSIFGVAQNRAALIAAGRVHSVLVSDDIHHKSTELSAFGHSWPACLTMVFCWGSAANGRLGTGTYEDAPFPELLPDFDGEAVVDVACGMDHSLVLVGIEDDNDDDDGGGGPMTGTAVFDG